MQGASGRVSIAGLSSVRGDGRPRTTREEAECRPRTASREERGGALSAPILTPCFSPNSPAPSAHMPATRQLKFAARVKSRGAGRGRAASCVRWGADAPVKAPASVDERKLRQRTTTSDSCSPSSDRRAFISCTGSRSENSACQPSHRLAGARTAELDEGKRRTEHPRPARPRP